MSRKSEMYDAITKMYELEARDTAMEPLRVKTHGGEIVLAQCPKCNGLLGQYFAPNMTRFCTHCGQRLKWENDDANRAD